MGSKVSGICLFSFEELKQDKAGYNRAPKDLINRRIVQSVSQAQDKGYSRTHGL